MCVDKFCASDVVIVVPVYTDKLFLSEYTSLRQLYKILGHYHITFIAPSKLRTFLDEKKVDVEYFLDENFSSVHSYSDLLLSPIFYSRFTKYSYMLIYQLDAFVFYDKLMNFCSFGYDYIGAPWPRSSRVRFKKRVGNGGFSLRNVSACLRVTSRMELLAEWKRWEYKNKNPEMNEDKFFCYIGNLDTVSFEIPNNLVALTFSMEAELGGNKRRLDRGKLPFGCHGWSQPWYFNIWEDVISRCVDDFEVVKEEIKKRYPEFCDVKEQREKRVIIYLISRITSGKYLSHGIDLKQIFSFKNGVLLWGAGNVGLRAKSLFDALNVHIDGFVDRDGSPGCFIGGIPVLNLTNEILNKYRGSIVLTTGKYENETSEILIRMGFESDVDFFLYSTLEKRLAVSYYRNFMRRIIDIC